MLITSIKAMEVDTDPANYGVHEVMNRAFMEQTGHLTRTVTWSRQASGLELFPWCRNDRIWEKCKCVHRKCFCMKPLVSILLVR